MARTLVGWTDAHYALDPNTNLALPNAAIDVQVLETGEALTDLQTPPGYIGQPFPVGQARTDESGFYGFTVPEGTGPVRVRVAATATEAPGVWLTPAGQVLDNGPVRSELAKKLDVEAASNTYVAQDTVVINPDDHADLAAAIAAAGGLPVVVAASLSAAANIPGFHDVPLEGRGDVTIAGYTWYANPIGIQKNTLYVDQATGSDTNVGFVPTLALASLMQAYTILQRQRQRLMDGQWEIVVVGTYVGEVKFSEALTMKHPLKIQGQVDVDGVPATTMDGTTAASPRKIGFWIEPGFAVEFANMNLVGYADGSGTGYGIIVKGGGAGVRVDNCHATDCDTGFGMVNNVSFSVDACTATNCITGFRAQYSSSGGFTDSQASGCENGFFTSRNAVTHIDYCTAEACTNAGVFIDMASRANVTGCDFKRNAVGVKVEGGAEWINNANNFFFGTADANTIPFRHFGASRETRTYSQAAEVDFLLGAVYGFFNHTGTTATTTIVSGLALGRLLPGHFIGAGKKIRARIWGSTSGTGTKNLIIGTTDEAGSDAQALASIPLSVAGAYLVELDVRVNTASAQAGVYRAWVNGQPAQVATVSSAFDPTRERRFRVQGQNTDAGATLQVQGAEFYSAG